MFFLLMHHRIEYQLPNLIVGAITKESLYNAFENGITAAQVLETGFFLDFFYFSACNQCVVCISLPLTDV